MYIETASKMFIWIDEEGFLHLCQEHFILAIKRRLPSDHHRLKRVLSTPSNNVQSSPRINSSLVAL